MPRADRVPFLPGQRLIAIRASLNDQVDVRLIVDSGAQRSVISRATTAMIEAHRRPM